MNYSSKICWIFLLMATAACNTPKMESIEYADLVVHTANVTLENQGSFADA